MSPVEHHGTGDELEILWALERPPTETTTEKLRAEVARRRRRMLATVTGEVILTIGLVALTVLLLPGDGVGASPGVVTWLGLLWLTWVIAAGFATWNRWGVWRSWGESARSHLALSEERARRRRRTATFVLVLVCLQLLLLFLVVGQLPILGLAIVVLYAGWAAWYRRRAGRELEEIRRIAAEFGTENPSV